MIPFDTTVLLRFPQVAQEVLLRLYVIIILVFWQPLPPPCTRLIKSTEFLLLVRYAANAYFNDLAPWKMVPKPDQDHAGDPIGLNTVLYVTAETLRVCGLTLHPLVRSVSG